MDTFTGIFTGNNWIFVSTCLTLGTVLAYVKSPTPKDKQRLTISLGLIPFSAGIIYFLCKRIMLIDTETAYALEAVPYIIIIYCLLFSIVISFSAWKKGGLLELKEPLEKGIIFGFIFGLLFGITFGLIFAGIFGLLMGEIEGLVMGGIMGLIGGLILGFAMGLIGGSYCEFKKERPKS